jgi:hypothetical protein
LWGSADADGFRRVYVGQGQLRKRIIATHLSDKRWWTRGAAIAVAGSNPGDPAIMGAERHTCLRLQQAERCLLGNRNLPKTDGGQASLEIADELVRLIAELGVDVGSSGSTDWSSMVLDTLDQVCNELKLQVFRPRSGRARVYERVRYTKIMDDSALWAYPDRPESWRGIEFGLGVLGGNRVSFIERLEGFLDERVSSEKKFPALPTPWAGRDQPGFDRLVVDYFCLVDLTAAQS